jgi:dihydroorotase
MKKYIIHNATLVNEGKTRQGSVLLKDGFIERIEDNFFEAPGAIEVNAEGMLLLPGAIDDQVHFREPGLTHKGNIFSESRAAVAGGITSFMEMPNTLPPALTNRLLEEKFDIAQRNSLANFSFYLGTGNNNLDEIKRIPVDRVCGLKIFMGSSTGDLKVDDPEVLRNVFLNAPTIITTHCEVDGIIKENQLAYIEKFGNQITAEAHPIIRSEEACYASSSFAVNLAKETGARLHVLHISTAKELELFNSDLPLKDKKITAEACVHHLWFCDEDYKQLGNFIKWNPAIKSAYDREEIRKAVMENKIDVLATDHAPHTLAEKNQAYLEAPSGGPLVQHAMPALLELAKQGVFSIEKVVEKMCHAPAILFQVEKRGFIREGYFADLVLINPNQPYTVSAQNILSKCAWSPFLNHTFSHTVSKTFVNGNLAYSDGQIIEYGTGMRLMFNR